jgi:peptidyl-prolyl cis-trans isomerase A (cyclophilin A)
MRKLTPFIWLLVVAINTSVVNAQPSPPGDPCTNCPPSNFPPPEANYGRTLLDLDVRHVGTIRIELFDKAKPLTVSNFLSYVLAGSYTNTFLHRTTTNFVVQGGSLQLVETSPGRHAVVPVEEKAPIINELGVGPFFSNERGTIAMAHEPGLTNVTTSHWFINLATNTFLDAVHTNYAFVVFGRVINGIHLLDKLNPGPTNTTISRLNLGGWLTEVPMKYGVTPATATTDDLLTSTFNLVALDMDLELVRGSNGTNVISWDSVSNKVHTIQYSNAVPPTWQTLGTVTGTGSRLAHTNVTSVTNRFYRVTYQP